MSSRHLSRRLERLEAADTRKQNESRLCVIITSLDKPDEIIEVRGNRTPGRRRRPRSPRWNAW
jgi:hypothetical protein